MCRSRTRLAMLMLSWMLLPFAVLPASEEAKGPADPPLIPVAATEKPDLTDTTVPKVKDAPEGIPSLVPLTSTAPVREFPRETKPGHPANADSRRSPLLVGLCVSHMALQMLDVHATLRASASGHAWETNPLVRPLVPHPAALIAFKAGIGVGIVIVAHHMAKRHPLSAKLAMVMINALYAHAVWRSYRNFPAR